VFLHTHSDPDTGLLHCQVDRGAAVTIEDVCTLLHLLQSIVNSLTSIALLSLSLSCLGECILSGTDTSLPFDLCSYLCT
jgi:hypothetical protein